MSKIDGELAATHWELGVWRPRSFGEPMVTKRESSDDWEVCPSGELTRMVVRLDARGRRARARQLAGAAGLSAAVVAVAVIVGGSLSDGGRAGRPHYGGISCATCNDHFANYHAHLTGDQPLADAALVASMETHLAKCDLCGPKFEMNYPGVLTADGGPTWSVLVATRPQFSIGQQAARW